MTGSILQLTVTSVRTDRSSPFRPRLTDRRVSRHRRLKLAVGVVLPLPGAGSRAAVGTDGGSGGARRSSLCRSRGGGYRRPVGTAWWPARQRWSRAAGPSGRRWADWPVCRSRRSLRSAWTSSERPRRLPAELRRSSRYGRARQPPGTAARPASIHALRHPASFVFAFPIMLI